MSNQPSHPALLIPGPIEFDDAVLQSMSHYRSVPFYVVLATYYTYTYVEELVLTILTVKAMSELPSSPPFQRLSPC